MGVYEPGRVRVKKRDKNPINMPTDNVNTAGDPPQLWVVTISGDVFLLRNVKYFV